MKKLLFVLFASLLVLGACGNQGETEKASEKNPSKSTVENKKEKKEENASEEKESKNTNEVSSEETQSANTSSDNGEFEQKTTNTQNQTNIDYNDPNTVVESYNGQTHVTTNNTINEHYIPGETDPIYEREYKHYYTPEEAQRAQQNSDAILREMGLEPTRYE
ncbi:hypothetical protein BU692_10190 [Staphylococcus chromogenes]|uniref:hypothetical protein n=1 Tax=Staphylococcus chromogenes TaxID=46126 RepID=UPI000D1A0ACC|nr:hypothetical protein [Staphylococcus chromogenes]PTG54695.1 hypothetical protein BU692_10190 [Staphylococcus chromogenes]